VTPQEEVLALLAVRRKLAGPVVVLSGRNERPDPTAGRLEWARKLAPVPLLADGAHTREEIERTLATVDGEVTLVTSNYHVPRAFLTTVSVLAGKPVRVWLVGVPGSLDPWPEERDKITQYQAIGQVASWEDGLRYLQWRDQ
jgi:hypothetical protein